VEYECELQERPAQSTLAIRVSTSVQDLPKLMGQAFGEIEQHLAAVCGQIAGPPFVAYHNMDMQNLEVEIGFPVSRALPGQGDIGAGEIPAGKVATCLHIGPYSEIPAAYQALSEWMESQGYSPTGVAYEIYLSDPNETPPQELMTQIVFPLREA
jgi:effector-binding domain-containing protein